MSTECKQALLVCPVPVPVVPLLPPVFPVPVPVPVPLLPHPQTSSMPSYYKRGAYNIIISISALLRNHNYMKKLKSIADIEDSC